MDLVHSLLKSLETEGVFLSASEIEILAATCHHEPAIFGCYIDSAIAGWEFKKITLTDFTKILIATLQQNPESNRAFAMSFSFWQGIIKGWDSVTSLIVTAYLSSRCGILAWDIGLSAIDLLKDLFFPQDFKHIMNKETHDMYLEILAVRRGVDFEVSNIMERIRKPPKECDN